MAVAVAAPNSSQSTAGGMPSHHRSTYRGGMTSTAAFTRTPSPRELRTDVIIALVVFLGAVISAGLSIIAQVYGDEQAPAWTAVLLIVAVSAPLAVRRRWPAPVAVFISVAYFIGVTLRVPELYAGNVAVFIALYTVGAWMNNRRAAMFVRVGIIIGMFAWLLIAMYYDALAQAEDADLAAGLMSPYLAFLLLQLLVNVLYFAGAYYFGERSWQAAAQRYVLEQRTEELEREREVTSAQAVALDRVRIARELHDVVAHHVSVMGVQAGAARLVVDSEPARAKQILADVENSSRDAISDFRQLLETLRAPGDQPQDAEIGLPGSAVALSDIARLAEASTAAGLPTGYTVVGDPAPVPGVVAVNLYRIAQESLTNARRHAGSGATADVRVRYDDAGVELDVVNTGRAVLAARPGLGQLGMRERALASGGTIELAPRAQGGFRVRARVPLPSTPTEAPA